MPEDYDVQPVLSATVAQQGVADLAGTIQYQAGAFSESAGDVAFAGPIADFILYGVVNGAFAQGPPDSTQNIEPVNNPLPYWNGPIQVSGGAITCQWVADSSSPSGYNLRFSIAAGEASDEAYIEQILPIGGTHYGMSDSVRAYFTTVTANTGVVGEVRLQYLDVNGATVGSEFTTSVTLNTALGVGAPVRAYADLLTGSAYYERTRIVLRRATGSTTTAAAFDVSDVRRMRADFLYLRDNTDPSTYDQGLVIQNSGVLELWPEHVGAKFSVSSGTITVGGTLNVLEQAAPATPPSNYGSIYVATNGHLHFINDAGLDTDLTP